MRRAYAFLFKTDSFDWSEALEVIHVPAAVKFLVSSVPECSIPISSLNHHFQVVVVVAHVVAAL